MLVFDFIAGDLSIKRDRRTYYKPVKPRSTHLDIYDLLEGKSAYYQTTYVTYTS